MEFHVEIIWLNCVFGIEIWWFRFCTYLTTLLCDCCDKIEMSKTKSIRAINVKPYCNVAPISFSPIELWAKIWQSKVYNENEPHEQLYCKLSQLQTWSTLNDIHVPVLDRLFFFSCIAKIALKISEISLYIKMENILASTGITIDFNVTDTFQSIPINGQIVNDMIDIGLPLKSNSTVSISSDKSQL